MIVYEDPWNPATLRKNYPCMPRNSFFLNIICQRLIQDSRVKTKTRVTPLNRYAFNVSHEYSTPSRLPREPKYFHRISRSHHNTFKPWQIAALAQGSSNACSMNEHGLKQLSLCQLLQKEYVMLPAAVKYLERNVGA